MPTKIESLTPAQEARFPEFIQKWTAIGLSTEPADRKAAEFGIVEAYRTAGIDTPRIVWCGSPLSQGLTRAIVLKMPASVWDSVGDSVRASVWDSVGASVGASVGDSVWDSVGASVGASVGDSVWASVGASVGDSVWDSVRDSVGDSVGASVWDSVWDSVGDSVWDSGYGQHDANWIGFYDYFRLACGLHKQTQKLTGIQRITENAGWWLPHQKICWISERHNVLNRNERGRLHKDGGPALSYPDGFSIWALNGIRVKQCQAETPAEKITPEEVLSETNADVRRELIRKVGVERMLAKLPHQSLNKRGDYEVLRIDFPGLSDTRYLRMLNPSVGVWHLEGLPRECDTVEAALNWRNQQWHTDAEVLT